MKTKSFLGLATLMALAAAGGWLAARHSTGQSQASGVASDGRKILYYQSAMHPWIKSDKPGKCTICGMDLVPVREGDPGFDTTAGLVTLSSNAINVIDIQTEVVGRRPLHRTLRVAGTIEDDDTRRRVISAYVDGRIDRLFVNYIGADVTENQPLATIYSPTLLAVESEYVALVSKHSAETGVHAEQARLVEATAQRLRRLGLNAAQIAALPQRSETNLDNGILSPMSGTVVARNVYEGQYVKEGDRLLEIADFSTMWFKFDAYERDLAWLKAGQRIDVKTSASPGKLYPSVISFIEPSLNDPTRTAKVRVELANPSVSQDGKERRELYHRLYAEGVVHVDIPEVLGIPRAAVLSPGGRAMVYLAKGGGAYEQRAVTLGRRGDDAWEVLGGLVEGDRIVTAGNLLIDAQAQLNQSAAPAEPVAGSPSLTNAATLNDTQRKVLSDLLALVDNAGSALAADSLDDFNRAAASLHTVLPRLLNAFDTAASWQPLVEKISATGHLEKASDLPTARREFLGLSLAVADLAQPLRGQKSFESLRVFQCPMLNSAIPGAPKAGRWIQLRAPLRNPFFGSRMIDCGTEVK